MGFSTILWEVTGGVATLTMNRPEKLNAFNGTMIEEMGRALDGPVPIGRVAGGAKGQAAERVLKSWREFADSIL